MKVKIKKLVPEAVIPTYAHFGDAAMDLTCTSVNTDEYGNIVYGTGLAFEIPKGYAMFIYLRSSNHKTSLMLTNHVGIVDSGYRGEVLLKYSPYSDVTGFIRNDEQDYKLGDRIGQAIIMPVPFITFEETDVLSDSERGTGGYGSTGR